MKRPTWATLRRRCGGPPCSRRGRSFPWRETRDPYRILDLPPLATRKQVEASFHRLTRATAPGDGRRRLIEEAYLLLSDPLRREAYDRSRGYRLHPALEAGASWRASVLRQRGLKDLEAGRFEAACRAFRLAVACQPWVAEYRSLLGLAMAEGGQDLHRARELCLEALRLEPDDLSCRRRLATVYEKVGLRKRAQRVLHHRGS